jgi:hypothetical protein
VPFRAMKFLVCTCAHSGFLPRRQRITLVCEYVYALTGEEKFEILEAGEIECKNCFA